MKLLRKFFLVILFLLALIFVVALFVKKEYSVEKNVTIEKSKSEVFEYVKYLKNQDNYSVWAQIDPNMEKSYRGTDGTIGFISAWDSNNKNVGTGEQEIKKIIEEERIDYELRFYEPFQAINYSYMILETYQDSLTIVKWGFDGKMDYPTNLMLLFWDMEEIIGRDLESGLSNLKKILEE